MNTKEFIETWNYGMSDYPILFIRRLREAQLTDEQIAEILKIIDGICHECWDASSGCRCWDDS